MTTLEAPAVISTRAHTTIVETDEPVRGSVPLTTGMLDADTAAVVYAAVDALEPGLRETVHLHYYQGLSLEETATALEIATSTVKCRLREGLGRVQRRLAAQESQTPSTVSTNRRP